VADEKSRKFECEKEWMLNRRAFAALTHHFKGLKSATDLFTTRLNAQTNRFFSWKPDPKTIGTDAFSADWSKFKT
jgi:hypothetical protein